MTFLDSNIFLYYCDPTDSAKQSIARKIVLEAVQDGGSVISAQVLNEFACVAMRKLKKTYEEVLTFIDVFKLIPVCDVKSKWTVRALGIQRQFGLQFYDSLLLAAAEANGCTEFLSEDLNDGQIYCGMKAVNPFKIKEVA